MIPGRVGKPEQAVERAPAGMALLLFIVFVLALVLRFGFWLEVRGTPLDRWHEWNQTDMATYLLQARQLAGVDWLATDPYHPYHSWQQIAPPEKWLEWYGPHQFHQAPAYAYLLALLERVVGDPLPWIKAGQFFLGALGCVLAALIAGRLGGLVAAGVAGFLAATYGPLLYLEGQILREGPGVVSLLVLTALLARFAQRAPGTPLQIAREVTWFAVPLGVFAMFHEMASVLLVASILAVGVVGARGGARTFVAGLVVLAIGYTVGFAPLLARNLAVGAPAFSVSCRTHINFVHANEADAPRGGADFSASGPGPEFVEILEATDGTLWSAAQGVWGSYAGDRVRILENAWLRFQTIWHRDEIPDNTSYAFFRSQSRVLNGLLTFPAVFALGVVGWFLALGSLRENRRGLAVHAVFGLVLVGLVASLTLIHPVARFRLYLIPLLWIYAGVGASIFVGFASRGQWPRAVATMAATLGVLVLQSSVSGDPPATGPRSSDYSFASRLALRDGELLLARQLADAAAHDFPNRGAYYANLALAHAKRGENEQALSDFERAYAMQPGLPKLRATLEDMRRNRSR